MAVKVTGFFQDPQGLIYQSPILCLVPKLEYQGVLHYEIKVVPSGSANFAGSFNVYNVDKNSLQYSGSNAYDSMIYSLESHAINSLSGSNDINKQSTFSRWNP